MVTWDDDISTDGSNASMDGMNDGGNNGEGFKPGEIPRMTTETNKAESLYGGSQTTSGESSTGHDSGDGFLGKRETAQVTYLRAFTLLVLLLAAGAVSATVFLVTKGAQQDDFETKFDGVAGKVLETFVSLIRLLVSLLCNDGCYVFFCKKEKLDLILSLFSFS